MSLKIAMSEKEDADMQAWIDRHPKCDVCVHLVPAELGHGRIGYCGLPLIGDRIVKVYATSMCEMHSNKRPEIDQ